MVRNIGPCVGMFPYFWMVREINKQEQPEEFKKDLTLLVDGQKEFTKLLLDGQKYLQEQNKEFMKDPKESERSLWVKNKELTDGMVGSMMRTMEELESLLRSADVCNNIAVVEEKGQGCVFDAMTTTPSARGMISIPSNFYFSDILPYQQAYYIIM